MAQKCESMPEIAPLGITGKASVSAVFSRVEDSFFAGDDVEGFAQLGVVLDGKFEPIENLGGLLFIDGATRTRRTLNAVRNQMVRRESKGQARLRVFASACEQADFGSSLSGGRDPAVPTSDYVTHYGSNWKGLPSSRSR